MFDDARHRAIDGMGPQIRKVNWFSTYHVHHRVTDHFRRRRETWKAPSRTGAVGRRSRSILRHAVHRVEGKRPKDAMPK
jgi:hypothetical protein